MSWVSRWVLYSELGAQRMEGRGTGGSVFGNSQTARTQSFKVCCFLCVLSCFVMPLLLQNVHACMCQRANSWPKSAQKDILCKDMLKLSQCMFVTLLPDEFISLYQFPVRVASLSHAISTHFCQAPVGYFDPMGLAKERMERGQQGEHGRVGNKGLLLSLGFTGCGSR